MRPFAASLILFTSIAHAGWVVDKKLSGIIDPWSIEPSKDHDYEANDFSYGDYGFDQGYGYAPDNYGPDYGYDAGYGGYGDYGYGYGYDQDFGYDQGYGYDDYGYDESQGFGPGIEKGTGLTLEKTFSTKQEKIAEPQQPSEFDTAWDDAIKSLTEAFGGSSFDSFDNFGDGF